MRLATMRTGHGTRAVRIGVALGTPGGVGHARQPSRYLRDGDVLVTTIAGLGQCRNRCVAEKAA